VVRGADFLDHLIRKAARNQDVLLQSPVDYLAEHPEQQLAQPRCRRGVPRVRGVWLDEGNDWTTATCTKI